jgi:hypothetical protein
MSVKIIGTLPKQQSTNNYNQVIKPKVADKTKQTNQAINRLAVRFSGDDETKPPKKTADDFLKKVVAEQPIKINDNNAKKETVAMKAGKSADKMTKEDYDMSFRRAVYSKAMVGVKLTDEEIKLADQTLKNANLYSSDYDLKSSVENLQEAQKKSGNIMPVKVGRENLERAKIAGQAVLQYQEYKSKEADANKANADKEVNEMFADQAKVLWNSGVNIIEGTINTGIDAALSEGGRKPLVLTNPFRPQVNFSGAKLDYQSRMMRRDINGKVDGEGLKRGDFTEMGVTILAPLVLGKVTTPTKLNELNLQFPLRNGNAAKIGVVNMQSELDPFIARQVGTEISKSPVASRAYSQMQKFGTEVKLDFGKPPKGMFGRFLRNENKSEIFMRNNNGAKETVATICHESCHGRSLQLGRGFGSKFDEFRASTREFLFTEGRKPTLLERKRIWQNVEKKYWDMFLEKNPFTGAKK